jgi:hypothetical protein
MMHRKAAAAATCLGECALTAMVSIEDARVGAFEQLGQDIESERRQQQALVRMADLETRFPSPLGEGANGG